jgi:hypothetical protein
MNASFGPFEPGNDLGAGAERLETELRRRDADAVDIARRAPALQFGGGSARRLHRKIKNSPAQQGAATAFTHNVPRTSGAKPNVTTNAFCAWPPSRSTPMRLRSHAAPNYFVASPGISIGCVEKLNTFKPNPTLCCIAQTTAEELA